MELLRQREEAALGDRLRPPLHPLASLQDLAHELVRLQLLQHVVHGELGVAVVQPDDHAERDVVLAHRVDERAPELAVARTAPQRPAHRVDDAVERLRDAPDLLHAERPDLRVVACEAEALDCGAGQVSLRPLGQHGHACDEIGARLEVRRAARRRGRAPCRRCARRRRGRARRAASCAAVSGRIIDPPSSACSASQRPSWESDAT